MKNLNTTHNGMEYFRGNEFSGGGPEIPGMAGGQMPAQPSSSMEVKKEEALALTPEREKAIEVWMEEVKTFIRGIDIGRL